jgi:hypothetical protein
LLLVESFEGLVRVDPATGNRRLAAPNSTFQVAPERIERLLDGRIDHSSFQPDITALFAYDLGTQTDTLFSGVFGGVTRGEGPEFAQLLDITVTADGRLVAYDAIGPTLFVIDPKSGNRRIASGGPGPIGEGPPLPEAVQRPLLVSFQPILEEKTSGRILH